MRLITAHDIAGYLARWAVQQHPYHAPEGLFEVVQSVLDKARADFKEMADPLPMHWFASYGDLKAWLSEALANDRRVTTWNVPRSGRHHGSFVAVSRYGGPAKEDDFIDIDALVINVARDVWDDALEFEKVA